MSKTYEHGLNLKSFPRKQRAVIRPDNGFTLIELMITLAVVAILAAIAYPSYTQFIQRGKIVEGLGELSTLRVRLEQYYQDNRNYGSTASACGIAMPSKPTFTFTCAWGAGATSQSFVAKATGLASGGMNGFTFTVNESNAQATTAFEGSAVTAACWMKKRGETCS
jgi:type IV pilus assembly protein PilE